jgi:anti-sigma factor RsiW
MAEERQTPPEATAEIRLTCQQLTDVIVEYVTGEMEAGRRTAFERHLSVCTDCVAFLNTYRETIRATRTVRAETLPGEMLTRVEQFLREKIASRPAP